MARLRGRLRGRGGPVQIRQMNEILQNLSRALGSIESNGSVGAMKAGVDILRRAKDLAPILTGALRSSGYVIPQSDKTGNAALVGFAAYYALYVHEDLTKFHATGQAKFLEQAISEFLRSFLKMIKNEVGTFVPRKRNLPKKLKGVKLGASSKSEALRKMNRYSINRGMEQSDGDAQTSEGGVL